MELLCKPWQKTYPIYFYYTNERGERIQMFLVSHRFFKVSIGLKGSYLAKHYRLLEIIQPLKNLRKRN
jgi:hypothetical protein